MNTIDIWHLIDGKYVHIVQTTDGVRRTYYTDGKKEGIVDITGHSYSELKYNKRMITIKDASGKSWEREAPTI